MTPSFKRSSGCAGFSKSRSSPEHYLSNMSRPDRTTILIVEDNAATATLQKRAVERAGYRAIMAQTAEEALKAIRSGPIDLILLDNRLPGEMSGLEFLTTLKALAVDVPVIMVSGSEHEGVVIQALRSGARDFIRKDINYLEYLPQAIAAVLQTARLDAQLRGERQKPQRPVLIVETAAAAAALEKRQLERAGFDVFTAHHADEALRILGEN